MLWRMVWIVTIIGYSGHGSTFFINKMRRQERHSGIRAAQLFTV